MKGAQNWTNKRKKKNKIETRKNLESHSKAEYDSVAIGKPFENCKICKKRTQTKDWIIDCEKFVIRRTKNPLDFEMWPNHFIFVIFFFSSCFVMQKQYIFKPFSRGLSLSKIKWKKERKKNHIRKYKRIGYENESTNHKGCTSDGWF